MQNTKGAAMNDPRLPSLSVKKFEDIKIGVSILIQPKKVIYNSIEILKSKRRVWC